MTNDLIQDVENAMRQERIEQYWKEYGPYILGGALLAVLLTAGLSGYRAWKQSVNERATTALLQALEAPDKVAAINKAAPSLKGRQAAIADLTAAGLLLKDGKKDQALVHYRAAADDKAQPEVYRELAQWLAVRLEWSMHPDKDKAEGLIKQLQPIIDDKDSPWTWHARIEAAEIEAHGLNDYAAARQTLAPLLASPDAGLPMKSRAQALDHVFSLQQPAAKPDNSKDKAE